MLFIKALPLILLLVLFYSYIFKRQYFLYVLLWAVFPVYAVNLYLGTWQNAAKSSLEDMAELYKKRNDIVLFTNPEFFFTEYGPDFHALTPPGNALLAFADEKGGLAITKSDRFGLNNDDQIWDEKKVSAIVMGDSFAHGCCLPREDSFLGYIEGNLNLRVLTMGVGGTGFRHQRKIFEAVGRHLPKSRLLIHLIYENDLHDTLDEMKLDYSNSYIPASDLIKEEIKERTLKTNSNQSGLAGLISFWKLKNIRNLFVKRFDRDVDVETDSFASVYDEVIKLSGVAERASLRYVQVLLPSYQTVSRGGYNDFYQQLKLKNSRLGIITYDLDLMLEDFTGVNTHYSRLGNEKLANLIGHIIANHSN